jgi:hypothetical protein
MSILALHNDDYFWNNTSGLGDATMFLVPYFEVTIIALVFMYLQQPLAVIIVKSTLY